jgi:hypothetical protein
MHLCRKLPLTSDSLPAGNRIFHCTISAKQDTLSRGHQPCLPCLSSLSPASPFPAGDLAFNIALGATLVAIPLSIGAVARSAFVKYKFTDRRVSVKTDAPWESELEKSYHHLCCSTGRVM